MSSSGSRKNYVYQRIQNRSIENVTPSDGINGECGNVSEDSKAGRRGGEMEQLKKKIMDRDFTIVQLEAKIAERNSSVSDTMMAAIRANTDHWQDSYHRVAVALSRLQKVNQGLEDKLLRIADKSQTEKKAQTEHISNLTTALTTAASAINRLKNDKERLQQDLNVAIQLLQCNSSQYSQHKIESLPSELQQRVKSRMEAEGRGNGSPAPKQPEMKVIKVPIPTFPPTAMVYSLNKCDDEEPDPEEVQEAEDMVSAAIMAAVLEERQREHKHCPTCTCNNNTNNQPSSLNSATEGTDSRHGAYRSTGLNGNDRENYRANYYAGGRNVKASGEQVEQLIQCDPSDTDTLVANLLLLREQCQNMQSQTDDAIYKVETNLVEDGCDELQDVCLCGRSFSSENSNVIDVGTQTVSSYIGESGKVHSTCIYCKASKIKGKHSSKGAKDLTCSDGDSLSGSSEVSCYASHTNKKCSALSPERSIGYCSWDWTPHTTTKAKGIDSGSPSTPTSFTCDEDVSSLTSPQLSPGKMSLGMGSSESKSDSIKDVKYPNSSSIIVDTIPPLTVSVTKTHMSPSDKMNRKEQRRDRKVSDHHSPTRSFDPNGLVVSSDLLARLTCNPSNVKQSLNDSYSLQQTYSLNNNSDDIINKMSDCDPRTFSKETKLLNGDSQYQDSGVGTQYQESGVGTQYHECGVGTQYQESVGTQYQGRCLGNENYVACTSTASKTVTLL